MREKRRRIYSSTRMNKVVISELSDGRMLERPESYLFFRLYKEEKFFSATTKYLCAFCGHKAKTTQINKTKIKDKTVFSLSCEKCGKLILREEFDKYELCE